MVHGQIPAFFWELMCRYASFIHAPRNSFLPIEFGCELPVPRRILVAMHPRLHSGVLAAVVLSFAVAAYAQAPETKAQPAVSAQAVWQPNDQTLQQARTACAQIAYPELGNCFVQQMQKAGASAQAVAFMHEMHNEAYLVKFENIGRVSIAWAVYPFRANANTACLLVNGTPRLLDVDDLSQIPLNRLKSDAGWLALVAKHPNAMLWPADRSGMTGVTAKTSGGGGQRFLVNYMVLDGCHACARLARMHYAFDFDNTGRLLGVRFVDLKALQ